MSLLFKLPPLDALPLGMLLPLGVVLGLLLLGVVPFDVYPLGAPGFVRGFEQSGMNGSRRSRHIHEL
jgi:hypothetical protein